MALEIHPLSPALGAEIRGVDPAAEIDTATFAAIRRAWIEHSILLFRNVAFTPEQQVAFTRRFGALHVMTPLELNLDGYPEVFVVSNRMRGGKPVGLRRAGWGWHSDGEDKLIPNAGSFLYAIACTPGQGDTRFASMYRALEALPAALRERIEGRRGRFSRIDMHLINYPDLPPLTEQAKRDRPDVYHPLIRTHPESHRDSLYIGRWATDIEGLDPREGADIVRRLREHSVREEFVYQHCWRPGDAILWDNRCTQHCAMPFDDERYERHMHRTTLEGDLPRRGEVVSSTEASQGG
jgi:alpha-ketoglutarate-dependent taurine dioxygenase